MELLSKLVQKLVQLHGYDAKGNLARISYQLALDLEEERLQKTQYLAYKKIKFRREAALSDLIAHSFAEVILYQEIFTQSGINPKEIKKEEDLIRFPLVTKRMFLERTPTEIIAKNISGRRIVQGITSGSTGEPFRHFKDKKFSVTQRANLYRPWRWAGVEPTSPIVHCSAPHAVNKTPNTVFLHPHFIKEKIAEYAEKIKSSGAKIIRGYPLTNFELVWNLKKTGYNDIKFTHAFFVGHALSLGIREFFKEEFNCETYLYYASEETGVLAAECERHDGMHIYEESFIIEILGWRGRPVPDGTRGKIVITSLLNEVMPLIRYDIGDIGMIIPEQCRCRRTSRRIIVEGRKEDMLLRSDGQSIYPGIVRDILDEYFYAFERYQVIQTAKDMLLLRVVPAEKFSQENLRKARNEFQECVGNSMKIIYEVVDEIPPLPSGKFRYFVSPYWREQYPKEILESEI